MHLAPWYLSNISKWCINRAFARLAEDPMRACTAMSSLLVRLGMLKSEFKVNTIEHRTAALVLLTSLAEKIPLRTICDLFSFHFL